MKRTPACHSSTILAIWAKQLGTSIRKTRDAPISPSRVPSRGLRTPVQTLAPLLLSIVSGIHLRTAKNVNCVPTFLARLVWTSMNLVYPF